MEICYIFEFIFIFASQNLMASFIHPSATVPIPKPNPCPNPSYTWNSVGIPSADNLWSRSYIVRHEGLPIVQEFTYLMIRISVIKVISL